MSTDLAEPETSPENSPDQAAQATQSSQAGEAGRARQAGQGGLIKAWRKLRVLLGLVALVLVGGILIALLAPRPKSNTYLDPGSSRSRWHQGADRHPVQSRLPANQHLQPAERAQRRSERRRGRPRATLVITSPGLLTARSAPTGARRRRSAAGRTSPTALSALAPAVRLADGNAPVDGPVDPACGIAAARLAGRPT